MEPAANSRTHHSSHIRNPKSSPRRTGCRPRCQSKGEPRNYHHSNSLGRRRTGQGSKRLRCRNTYRYSSYLHRIAAARVRGGIATTRVGLGRIAASTPACEGTAGKAAARVTTAALRAATLGQCGRGASNIRTAPRVSAGIADLNDIFCTVRFMRTSNTCSSVIGKPRANSNYLKSTTYA